MINILTDQTMETLLLADIFDILGLAGIQSQKRQEIATDMIETIQNRIIARLQDALPTDAQDSLIVLLNSKDRSATLALLSAHNLPSLETMAVEEGLIYKHQLANETIV